MPEKNLNWPLELAIEPKSKADQDKLGVALAKLVAEDPSFGGSRADRLCDRAACRLLRRPYCGRCHDGSVSAIRQPPWRFGWHCTALVGCSSGGGQTHPPHRAACPRRGR